MQLTDGEAPVVAPARSSWRIFRPKLFVGAVLSAGIVAVVAFGVWFYFVDDESASESSALLEAPVTRGDLVDSVSSDGTIVFPERSPMSFGTAGTLSELLVSVGDEVLEGQEMARLDDLTTSNLATSVEEARASLEKAKDDLAEAKSAASDLELADGNLAVEEARASLVKAEDDLAEAKSAASDLELADGNLAVVSAQSALDDATEALATLRDPLAGDLLHAQAAVTMAESKLVDAQEALSDLEALPDPLVIADAQLALTFAIDTHINALADRLVTRREWEVSIEAATTALSDARADYGAEFEKWLGYTLDESELGNSPASVLSAARIDLDAIFSNNSGDFWFTPTTDDPATPWNEMTVFWWTFLSPQSVVGSGDSGTGLNGVTSVEDELTTVWDALILTTDAMADVESSRAVSLTNGEKAVSSALSAVTAAEDALSDADQPASELDMEIASDSIAVASSDLDDARADLVFLSNPGDSDIQSAKTAVIAAQAKLAHAQSDLTDMLAIGSDIQLIDLRTVEVDAAGAVLANAISLLTDVLAIGSDIQLIDLRTVEVDAAGAVLANAISLLDDAVLRSPVDGIVGVVNSDVGDELQRNTIVIEIVDPTIVTVEMDVDQVDILAIAVGAEAAVTLDALVGQILSGTVTDIGVASNGQSGSVTFPVTVTMELPRGTDLLEGLTATAEMITNFRPDLLLIPSVAVGGSFTQPSVEVLRNGSAKTVFVTLDGGNKTFAVIGSGVVEGDTVLFKLPGVSEQNNPFQVLRAGAGFGAGFTGGGGRDFGRGNATSQGSPPGGGGGPQ